MNILKRTVVAVVSFRDFVLVRGGTYQLEAAIKRISYYPDYMEVFGKSLLSLFNVDIDNYDDDFVTMTKLPVYNDISVGPLYIISVDFKKSFMVSCGRFDEFKLYHWKDIMTKLPNKNNPSYCRASMVAFTEVSSRKNNVSYR